MDLLSGETRINLLEPRQWNDGSEPDDPEVPPAFRGTPLAQHISFLRDIFRVYKNFDTPYIDTLELMIERLYRNWKISDATDFSQMAPTDYYLEQVPGAMFRIGTASETPASHLPLHNAGILFDEQAIPTGAAVMCQLARDYLKNT